MKQLSPTSWATCNYRPVTSVSRTTFDMEGQRYTIGGVGSSGAYEFLPSPRYPQRNLLSEAILETLVVSNLPITQMSSSQQKKLARRIESQAIDLLGKRERWDPYAWPLNCRDLTDLAIEGAQLITKRSEVDMNPDYKFCPMHKYNPQYGEHYVQAGLPVPGSFGRLRCPSNCAETGALARNAYALVIPIITGIPISFLIGIGYAGMGQLGQKPNPANELMYLTPDPSDNQKLSIRNLIVDHKLFIEPFKNNPRNIILPAVFMKLHELGISLDQYETITCSFEDGNILLHGGTKDSILETNGLFYAMHNNQPIAAFPIAEMVGVKTNVGSPQNLWTSTLPCHHCLNTLERGCLENIFIDHIDWQGLKGDDGLVIEALLNLPARKVVVNK